MNEDRLINSEYGIISREYPVNTILSGAESDDFRIYISNLAFSKMDAYLSSDVARELGGVLTGNLCRNDAGKDFIMIDDIIIAKYAESDLTKLTFTHKTWEYINNSLSSSDSAKSIIGWFHSHPGHKVFMSGYDVFIQENFFNLDHMVAYVFDPVNLERGFFFRKNKELIKTEGYYIYDKGSADSYGEVSDGSVKDKRGNTNSKLLYILLIFLIINFALSFFLMYRISEMNSKYIEIAMLEKKISDLITDVGNMKIQIAKTKEENPRLYTVREGENLESIALRFYNDRTGVNMLVKQNKLRDEFDIEAGRILEIPDR
jgi:hypothetical protein